MFKVKALFEDGASISIRALFKDGALCEVKALFRFERLVYSSPGEYSMIIGLFNL